MRKMPQIPEVQKSEIMTNNFRGYNHNEIISDGEMYDMTNLSGDAYPALTVRKKRGATSFDAAGQDPVPLRGILGGDKLVMIRGNRVYYDGVIVPGLTLNDTNDVRKIVRMGAYVCIWPDKMYFNTIKQEDYGSMERLWDYKDHMKTPPLDFSAQMCRADGTDYDMTDVTVSANQPQNPTKGDLWIDQSGETDVLRQYEGTIAGWVEVPTVYVKLSAEGIGKGLAVYDTVTISGMEAYPSNVSDRTKKQIDALNADCLIYGSGDNYIIVAGILNAATYITIKKDTVTVNREVPDLDYVCEANNRLWGCVYKYDLKIDLRLYRNAEWTLTLCDRDGTNYDLTGITVSETAPESPSDGDLWIKYDSYREEESSLRKYSSAATQWQAIQTYVKAAYTDIGKGLNADDYIRIDGIEISAMPWSQQEVHNLNGNVTLTKAEDNYIVFPGIVSSTYTTTTGQKTIRQAPKLENFINEIRACKLGDFKNWRTYMGLSTDSYAAGVGTDGPFTGAITQQGYPVFFKENAIHRIFGYNPDSFQIQTDIARGIQAGSWRSAAVVSETILYKSLEGFMAYDGNTPRSISEALGDERYEDARAGAINGKYYVSMKKPGATAASDEWVHFCYDTKRGFWHKEDGLKAMGYGAVGTELYAIDEENNTLVTIGGSSGTKETTVPWEAVFGISGIEYRNNVLGYSNRSDIRQYMYLSRFILRMWVEPGTAADLWIEYDGSGEWTHQGEIRGKTLRSFLLPVIPKRCDHLRFRLTGTGGFRLFSISRIMEVGGDG